jgi:hypothetical protein
MLAMITMSSMEIRKIGVDMVTRTREVVVVNKAQCKLCGDVIQSTNRHDFVRCGCGEIAVDGGTSYLKRSAKNLENIIELSETYEENYESQF